MWTYDDGAHLAHFGVKGQKWGVRNYQNPNGSLTPEGQERYLDSHDQRSVNDYVYGLQHPYQTQSEHRPKPSKETRNKRLGVVLGVIGGITLAAVGITMASKYAKGKKAAQALLEQHRKPNLNMVKNTVKSEGFDTVKKVVTQPNAIDKGVYKLAKIGENIPSGTAGAVKTTGNVIAKTSKKLIKS